MPATDDENRMKKKLDRYKSVAEVSDIVNFKGGTLLRGRDGFFRTMHGAEFARIVYKIFPGALKQQIMELEHKFRTDAEDKTDLSHLVAFGDKVWDMNTLDWSKKFPRDCVFRSRINPSTDTKAANKYILELANGDKELALDILQGLAPLFMSKKPAGVIWFIGGGANGKSSLINAMYRIIGHHFCSLTVGAIEDGRDTPRLNGVLGNLCRESSESRIDDSERYKAIGTHEPFEVHKFHTQEMVTITGDIHHVFNANNIPIFTDKTQGARRRTLIIPFNAVFKDNPTFEDNTFTDKFLGGLITLVLEATHIIRDNQYQYKFSETTEAAKAEYDSEVNSAEAFYDYLLANKVEAFSSYHMLKMAYESWCGVEGLVPLGITNLKRAMKIMGKAYRKTIRREDGTMVKWYFFGYSKTRPSDLVPADNGLYSGLKKAKKEPLIVGGKATQIMLGEDW